MGIEWTKANIAAFGGDPSRITIFGESSGASSVDAMLTSYLPPQKPPFHAAIMQSGQSSLRAQPADPSAAWTKLAADVGCGSGDVLTCMRGIDASVLKDREEHLMLSFPYVTDNYTYYGAACEPNRLAGDVARVPTLAGNNHDEGSIFTLDYPDVNSYLSTVFANNEQIMSAVLATYPIGSPGIETERDQIVAIATHYSFQCTAAVVANDTKTGGVPSYR
jgi:carboxylesterase type B